MFQPFKMRKKIFVLSCFVLTIGILCSAAMIQQITLPTGCRTDDIAPTTTQIISEEKTADSPPETTEKVVYLTFDDGPSKTTEKVLDILKEEGVCGTFFVIAAENNQEYLPLLQRTVTEGNMIALHSCTHEYKKIYASAESYWEDIEELKVQIEPYVETDIAWLRFPGGSTNTVSHRHGGSGIMNTLKEQATEKGYHFVDWNISADDSVGGHPSAEKIYNNVIRHVDDRSTCVVLMHDTNATKSTAEALPQIIQWFKKAGYRFDTIDHLEKEI